MHSGFLPTDRQASRICNYTLKWIWTVVLLLYCTGLNEFLYSKLPPAIAGGFYLGG